MDRSEGRIALVQPEKLLEALLENYAPPKAERKVQLKTPGGLEEFFRRAEAAAGWPRDSGRALGHVFPGPVLRRSAFGHPDPVRRRPRELKRRTGEAWKPADRFADLTVVETRDPTPFFDARPGEDGVRFASPVQAYLELAAGGDKRDSEIARQVRARVLQDLGR